MSLKEVPHRRPDSAAAKVYPFLIQGESRPEIEKRTGFHGPVLTEAIRSNYRFGHVAIPSLEERRRRLGENTSFGKGGVELAIKPYLGLDLTAKQTQVALGAFDGKTYLQRQIIGAYGREVRRHGLKRPTQELTVEAQRDKRRSEEELLEIVRIRKIAAGFVAWNGISKPQTLEEWRHFEKLALDNMTLMEDEKRIFAKAVRVVHLGYGQPQRMFGIQITGEYFSSLGNIMTGLKTSNPDELTQILFDASKKMLNLSIDPGEFLRRNPGIIPLVYPFLNLEDTNHLKKFLAFVNEAYKKIITSRSS